MSEMDDEIDFESEMESAMIALLRQAKDPKVKIEEKVKAYDVVQQYYANRKKYEGLKSSPGKPNGVPTFRQFKASASEGSSQEN